MNIGKPVKVVFIPEKVPAVVPLPDAIPLPAEWPMPKKSPVLVPEKV